MFPKMMELAELRDTVRWPLYEHAPPLAESLVDVVDFELSLIHI